MTDDWDAFSEREWNIVGAGRVGRTLGLLAGRLGVDLAATWNRSETAANETASVLGLDSERAFYGEQPSIGDDSESSKVVWVTVVDDALADVSQHIAADIREGDIILHTSGVKASTELRAAGIERGHVGSIHPLQAITEPRRAVDVLAEAAWTIEGDLVACDFARAMLAELGVTPVEIEADKKPLYHASAVAAANLLVALMDVAVELGEAAGLTTRQAYEMLVPLAKSAVENLENQSTAEALSGPVARGDDEVIERHRAEIAKLQDGDSASVYDALTGRARDLLERAARPAGNDAQTDSSDE